MPPAGGEHGDVQFGLGGRMRLHADATGAGYVIGEVGFYLARNPDTVRAPDVAFVARERFPHGLPQEFIDGAPDLAVEVVSPNDSHADVMEKVGEYLDAGTRLVWVASRRTRSVTVHRPDGTAQTLRADDVLSGEDVLPGFQVRVRELFGG